jgi:hypothetical protein
LWSNIIIDGGINLISVVDGSQVLLQCVQLVYTNVRIIQIINELIFGGVSENSRDTIYVVGLFEQDNSDFLLSGFRRTKR